MYDWPMSQFLEKFRKTMCSPHLTDATEQLGEMPDLHALRGPLN